MTNHLKHETSPYLLQHADNPVNWHPWNETSLQLARDLDKPILLSIGYAACHWCHVMAHECFENVDIAAVMNESYVCIKVDREERPDLDKVYQTAHQLITQRPGGWPLTLALTPDAHAPIFAGTYFPPTPRGGLPDFTTVLRQVEAHFREHRDDMGKHELQFSDALSQVGAHPPANSLPGKPLFEEARQQLAQQFDREHGGFGNEPKFPHPTQISFLMRYWQHQKGEGHTDKAALDMPLITLKNMAMRGLNDQLAGGFYRYSVDERWEIPHFEKMGYDNAQLMPLYAEAYQITQDAYFADIAQNTADWIIGEMQAPEGGFYSTLDADSEGEEGRYYVWSNQELKTLLSAEHYHLASTLYQLDDKPNFEGKWHLNQWHDLTPTAKRLEIKPELAAHELATIKQSLLVARNKRIRPGLDDKILTSWNALMIKGLATSARILQRDDYYKAAVHALDFIHSSLWDGERLLATHRAGKSHLNAYLDDYVMLADALLSLCQTHWDSAQMNWAVGLMEHVHKAFEDDKNGGHFFTEHEHEQLLYRPKPGSDDSTPSGNGVAANVLLKLGHLLGRTDFIDSAERTLRSLSNELQSMPSAHASLLLALMQIRYEPQTIIIRGKIEEAQRWKTEIDAAYQPLNQCFAIPDDVVDLPDALALRIPKSHCCAYVCSKYSCSAPIDSLEELKDFLT